MPVLAWHDAREAALGRLATAAGPIDVIVMDIEALTMLVSANLMSRIADLSDQIRIVIPDAVWSALAVAALTAGQSVAEIIEDYPGLTPAQVEAAVEYAKVYPRPGRPLPAHSLKRMLSDLAATGIWDLEPDSEPLAPQPVP